MPVASRCPKCRQSLEVVTAGAVASQRCRSCKGLWFGAGAMEPFLKELDKQGHVPEVDKLELAKGAGSHTQKHPVYSCPVCALPMDVVNYGYDSNIFVDRCGKCGGVFLDKNEVIPCAKYLKGHPGMARMAKAWTKEMGRQEGARDELGYLAGGLQGVAQLYFEKGLKKAGVDLRKLEIVFGVFGVIAAVIAFYTLFTR